MEKQDGEKMIIKKEKARQEELLHLKKIGSLSGDWRQHKQSLINLKEYMEELDIELSNLNLTKWILSKRIHLKENIQELTKLIEAYS